VRERDSWCAPELQKAPGLERQEGERDDLGSREEGAEGHRRGGRPREGEGVQRADHPADGVEHDVEEDDRERHPLGDDAEQYEDVGDHDGRKELQKVLDPQVHDHEAPVVRRREARVGPGEEAHGVERRDGQRREEEHPRHVAKALVTETPPHRPEEHDGPEEEPGREQYLPEAPEVEVLVALVAEPGPQAAHPTVDAQKLADEAAEHHYCQGAE